MGGMKDQHVSSAGFKVQGNPQKVDGNYYPEYNALLDHNEVVIEMEDGPFVFSDSLHPNDDMSVKSYAKMAAPHLKALKEAEKILERSKFDDQAKSTVQKSYAILKTLRASQEELANRKGLRNPDGTPVQEDDDMEMAPEFYTGGPMSGVPLNPYHPITNPNPNPNNWHAPMGLPSQYVPKSLNKGYEEPDNRYASIPGFNYTPALPGMSLSNAPLSPMDAGMLELQNLYPPKSPTGTGLPTPQAAQQAVDFRGPQDPATPTTTSDATTTRGTGLVSDETTTTASTGKDLTTPWTFGDYFKVGELAGKFAETLQPAEVEMPFYDTSKITRQVMDPTRATARVRSQFADARNAMDFRNPAARAAATNQMLANVLDTESNIATQYQQANQQGLTNFEQRVGEQNRFNTLERARVSDINSRNRAALDAARQNVFTSVGQFGEDLNRKYYANQQMEMFKTLFPEGYNSMTGKRDESATSTTTEPTTTPEAPLDLTTMEKKTNTDPVTGAETSRYFPKTTPVSTAGLDRRDAAVTELVRKGYYNRNASGNVTANPASMDKDFKTREATFNKPEGVKAFQDEYNEAVKKGVFGENATYITADGKMGPQTKKAWNDYKDASKAMLTSGRLMHKAMGPMTMLPPSPMPSYIDFKRPSSLPIMKSKYGGKLKKKQ